MSTNNNPNIERCAKLGDDYNVFLLLHLGKRTRSNIKTNKMLEIKGLIQRGNIINDRKYVFIKVLN